MGTLTLTSLCAHACHQASIDEVMEYLTLPDTDVNMRAEVRRREGRQ
jgi:hypothetical protein